MDERDRSRLSPEIFVYATNKNFLNVYDALRIDKIKLEVAGYDQASGKQTGIAGAWLDVDDMRLLAHLIVSRLFRDVLANARFEKFGGSERDEMIESRTLVIEWDTGEGGRFAGYPYRVTIANGPGVRTPTGAVKPKGDPTSRQSMRLPEADLMKIMLAVQSYIQAYEAAHHHRLVAAKVRELQEKMAERATHHPNGNGNGAARPAATTTNGTGAPRPAAPAANGNSPLHVVRPSPAPTPARSMSAPPSARPVPAPRPAASTAPTEGSRPVAARPQPQVMGNAALAVEPELDLDMDAPPPTALRPVEPSRARPEPARPQPENTRAPAPTRNGAARPQPEGTRSAGPTPANRPANSSARPFRSSAEG